MLKPITTVTSFGLALILLTFLSPIHAQSLQQITHLRGVKDYNGVKVTVTSAGKTDSLQYCGTDTWPYYVGYNSINSGCADGSFTFSFSTPVKEVVLNLSALSHSDGTYNEEARIFVNGRHYMVKTLGKSNSCGEGECVVTPEGNIRPCNNCTGSGSNGIKIKGPINSITIECNIILGEPMGFVASVFMGPKAKDEITLNSYTASFVESAAGDGRELVIESPELQNAEISIKDASGNPVTIRYRSIEPTKIIIDASEFNAGEYWLEIKLNGVVEKQKLFIQ